MESCGTLSWAGLGTSVTYQTGWEVSYGLCWDTGLGRAQILHAGSKDAVPESAVQKLLNLILSHLLILGTMSCATVCQFVAENLVRI